MNTNFVSHRFPSLFADFLSPVFISEWKNEIFEQKKLTLKVLRLDAQHKHIGGNKLYKLYYNLLEAKKQNKQQILTFGGAYSNHLRATAFATKQLGMQSIAIIRGEEHQKLNPVLDFCKSQDMQFYYISRAEYREKNNVNFVKKIKEKFENYFIIPEGGSNAFALKGTSYIPKIAFDLIDNQNIDYFVLTLATGGTAAGILNGIEEIKNNTAKNTENNLINFQKHLKSKVLAISALKGGDFLKNDVENLLNEFYENDAEKTKKALSNLILETNFHEGGYAKKSERLKFFIEEFNQKNEFEIEPIYTAKAFFAVYELAKTNFFEEGQTIVLIHTGGIM